MLAITRTEEPAGETAGQEWPRQPADWRQLGVLVLDGNMSMSWEVETEGLGLITKAKAINYAVRELFSRFKVAQRKYHYTFAVVKFHEHVTEEFPPTPVKEIDDEGDYDPTSSGTGQTFIGSGLERAGEICEQFFKEHTDDIPTSAIVILVTNRECILPERTREIAAMLKADSRIRLAVSCFAATGEPLPRLELLREICSSPHEHYVKITYDTGRMVRFWELLFHLE